MKAILKYALVAAGVTVIGAAVTASGIYSANRAKERFMEIPQITNEEELSAALEGPKQTYCLTNMVVSGTAAEDPFEILTDEYLYIQYIKEVCEQDDTGKNFKWEYSANDVVEGTYASEVMLFDEYEATVDSFMAVMNAVEFEPEWVKEEYAELIDGAYYPKQIGDYPGNTRYTIAALPMESEVAMYATVGEGQIVLEYNKDKRCCMVQNGTAEDLRAYYGDESGVIRILIGLMFITPMGLLLLAAVIIFTITGTIAQKSADRKKAAQAAKNNTKKK